VPLEQRAMNDSVGSARLAELHAWVDEYLQVFAEVR
jgi:hypothetical protein